MKIKFGCQKKIILTTLQCKPMKFILVQAIERLGHAAMTLHFLHAPVGKMPLAKKVDVIA
jgi:hypothetical protein